MRRTILAAALLLAATNAFAGTGRVLIINVDPVNVGFNDTTPAAPVGGNPGTTVGEQRLNVFQRAAERWQSLLDTNVDIRIRASFAPLDCKADSGVLGQAGPRSWKADFAGAPREKTWYPIALANKFAGTDLDTANDDIFIQFNGDVGKPNCLAGSSWYYGFDGNEGTGDALFSVVLHEIAHGLGLAGRGLPGFAGNPPLPTVFETHALDLQAGLRWDQMTEQQRAISMLNTSNLVWDGPVTRANAPSILQPVTTLTITAPASAVKNYDIGTAAFGTPANSAALAGTIVQATDAANTEGPATTDGCSAFSNASAISGNIAIVDRGTCTFVTKAKNAQAAGAKGLVVVDNKKDTCLPPSMGGSDDSITIPILSVSQDDGAAIRSHLGESVSAILRADPSRLAGASDQGYVRLYAPCTFAAGSSIYHWDVVATPNLLMEPFINDDLTDSVDLTIYQLMDIGWTMPRTGRRFLKR